MLILGVETSCDETSAALVEAHEDAATLQACGGRARLEVKANLIASQVDAHQLFGGVVPEIASRKHLEALNPLLAALARESGLQWPQVGLVAVTHGPGLSGALLVGVAGAKALSLAHDIPCQPVNHVEGHICSTFLANPELKLPMLCLVVSGGHTDLVLMTGLGQYQRLGRTRDDAVGEAYDKVARALGLPMPGGPSLERAAAGAEPGDFRFTASNMEPSFDFSYSGLKTAATTAFARNPEARPQIAAAFQRAAVRQLSRQVKRALAEYRPATLGVCGGVAANQALRAELSQVAQSAGVDFVVPEPILCTDNAAMIAVAGYFRYASAGKPAYDLNALNFEARSVLPVA